MNVKARVVLCWVYLPTRLDASLGKPGSFFASPLDLPGICLDSLLPCCYVIHHRTMGRRQRAGSTHGVSINPGVRTLWGAEAATHHEQNLLLEIFRQYIHPLRST